MNKKPSLWGGILGLLLALLGFGVQPSAGQEAYEGLDVLFLINQSLTMDALEGGNRQASDPSGARFSSVQGAVNWLGSYRAQQHRLGNDLEFNVASVYFGGIYFPGNIETRTLEQAVVTPLDWTPVAPNSLDEWQQQQDEILTALSANTFGKRHLGLRDYLTGFEAGLAQFADQSNPNHQQVIILVTDGKPCAVQYQNYADPNCKIDNVQQSYMSAVQNLIQQQFNDSNQTLQVLYLDPTGANWSTYGDLWSNISRGNAEALTNANDLHVKIHDLLADIVATKLSVSPGTQIARPVNLPQGAGLSVTSGAATYDIPPYQEMLTVSLFKSNPNSRLVLRIDDAEVNNAEVLGANENVEIWNLFQPPPGKLTISSQLNQNGSAVADPAAAARLDLLPVSFQFDQPGGNVRQYLPVKLTLAAVDSAQKVLPIYADADYQLQATVTIQSPTGAVSDLTLKPDRVTNQYSAQFTPLEVGQYTATLRAAVGDAVDFKPSPLTLTAAPVTVQIEGVPRESLEDLPQIYSLALMSGGAPVTELRPQTWVMTFVPKDGPTCSNLPDISQPAPTGAVRFVDFQGSGGAAVMTAIPATPGEYRVCAAVTILDLLSGAPITVYADEVGLSTVNVVEGLALLLTRPETRASAAEPITRPDEATLWLPILENAPDLPFELVRPYWESQPLALQLTVVVEADAQNVNGFTPVEIGEAIPAAAGDFFSLRVLNADNQQVASNVHLTPTDNPAVWGAELPPLPAGTYTITIETPSTPIGTTNHAFLPNYARFTQTLTIVPNAEKPRLLVIYAGLLAAAAVLLLNFGVVAPTRRRRNRLRGVLYIEAQQAQTQSVYPVKAIPLGSGPVRDHWAIPLAELPLLDPPLTHLEVRMRRGKLHAAYGLQGDEPQPVELTGDGERRDFGSSVLDPNWRFVFRWDANSSYQPPAPESEGRAE